MNKKIAEMSLKELATARIDDCSCGKAHHATLKNIVLGAGVITEIPALLKKYGAEKAFVFFDKNTEQAAGQKVLAILQESSIPFTYYRYPQAELEPDNEAVGQLCMAFDPTCDVIIGVGSGTLNDLGKILAALSSRLYMIIGTAPSMDGYASATSSMNFDGVKVSLNSKLPDIIVADTEILSTAPLRMFQAGFGDMVAKYISLADWRIAQLVTGEYYCEEIAELVRRSLKQCMATADGILSQAPETAAALTEGLIYSGLAMSLAGVSRPASGTEHYFSHIWDMRSAALGTSADSHGLQCLIGSLEALRIMKACQDITPNAEKANEYTKDFDKTKWASDLRQLLGSAAEPLIALEEKEQKYQSEKHRARLQNILQHWEEIQAILARLMDETANLDSILKKILAPTKASELNISEPQLKETFKATKDIRDKYIITRLLWDLGELDEVAELLYGNNAFK